MADHPDPAPEAVEIIHQALRRFRVQGWAGLPGADFDLTRAERAAVALAAAGLLLPEPAEEFDTYFALGTTDDTGAIRIDRCFYEQPPSAQTCADLLGEWAGYGVTHVRVRRRRTMQHVTWYDE
jgi:hypothetical protein